MKRVAALVLTLSLPLPGLLLGADLLSPGAKLKLLGEGYSFTEGPACDKQGNVFFTDQPNDRIVKCDTEGNISIFMQPCGRANGLTFDRAGFLWACADEQNQLWRISPDKRVTVFVKEFAGKLLNGPNDLWIRPVAVAALWSPADPRSQGSDLPPGMYFTDPFYKRPYWKRGPSELTQAVYYFVPKSGRLVSVIDDLKQPNGIIGTQDGRILYVADIGAGKTYSYLIAPNGGLTDKKLFCEMGSDGMTIDNAGNVYLTGKGVTVFSPEGKKLQHIEVPEPWTANVCFGGRSRQTLYITAGKGLYGLEMRVRGVDSQ